MARHTPGNYVPLDVNYAHDRAIRMAGPDAELLYVRALAYAKRTRTDGLVPDYDLDVVAVGLRNVRRSVGRLVSAGLWTAVDGGWLIRSWLAWNQRVADEEAFHEKQGEHGSKGNHERWHVAKGITSPDCPHCDDPTRTPDRVPDRQGESPLRELKGTEEEGSATTRKRASQLPEGFRPSDKHIHLASELGVDLRREWPKFVDHHRAKGSTFKDWSAALNNWIRKAAEYGGPSPALRLAPSGEPILPVSLDDRR